MEEQDNNMTPPTPNDDQQPAAPEEKTGAMGPVTGIIIVVAIIILGGLYFWGGQGTEQESLIDPNFNSDITEPSDEPLQIESDLDAFDTTAFDAELEADLKAIESAL